MIDRTRNGYTAFGSCENRQLRFSVTERTTVRKVWREEMPMRSRRHCGGGQLSIACHPKEWARGEGALLSKNQITSWDYQQE